MSAEINASHEQQGIDPTQAFQIVSKLARLAAPNLFKSVEVEKPTAAHGDRFNPPIKGPGAAERTLLDEDTGEHFFDL